MIRRSHRVPLLRSTVTVLLCAGLALALAWVGGCRNGSGGLAGGRSGAGGATVGGGHAPGAAPLIAQPPPAVEPTIRVRLGRGLERTIVEAAGTIRIHAVMQPSSPLPAAPSGTSLELASPVTVSRSGGALYLQSTSISGAYQWRVPGLRLESAGSGPIQWEDRAYPGVLVVCAEGGEGPGMDVVNHVPLETYLPGVLDRELYPSWQPETFKAQAVAARSYAVAQMTATRQRHYDLESTQASQAYTGLTLRARPLEAVAATRGQFLVYDGRVVCAYYSSCCGGAGQDAVVAFREGRAIPPLAATQDGTWCQASSLYRWGPIFRDKAELAARLAGWGQATGHPVRQLRQIGDLRIASRNRVNRPDAFTVTGGDGREFTLGPEEFRVACNFTPAGLAAPAQAALLRSSFVDIAVAGNRVQFMGAGFGHGAGMCQWGAQGMAVAGHRYDAILAFYYPGARLQKSY